MIGPPDTGGAGDVPDTPEAPSMWPTRAAADLAPFGVVPADLIDESGRQTLAVSDALTTLVSARDGAMGKILAARMIAETMAASGLEYSRMLRMIMEYTEGTPVHREVRVNVNEEPTRVIEIVQRSAEYSVVEERGDGDV